MRSQRNLFHFGCIGFFGIRLILDVILFIPQPKGHKTILAVAAIIQKRRIRTMGGMVDIFALEQAFRIKAFVAQFRLVEKIIIHTVLTILDPDTIQTILVKIGGK